MHTDSSITELETVTVALGNCLRHFSEVVCLRYDTKETAKEYGARQRKAAKKGTSAGERQPKTYSLRQFKLHALGYYPSTIRRLGPTDGYSTQLVRSQVLYHLSLPDLSDSYRENLSTSS